MKINIEKIDFKRPNAETCEQGLRISNDRGSIIIDSDFNILLNCSYEHYYNDMVSYIIE